MNPIKILVISLCLLLLLLATVSKAQDRCGAVEYQKHLQQQNLLHENEVQFENWIKETLQKSHRDLGTERTLRTQRTKAAYQVPVVVHVIHNGEAVGTGTNISDAQILSQISVLNKDYNRLNADASQTPPEFLPVAGSLDIEFVLAKRTPEGLPTNGIVRKQGSKTSWTIRDNYQLKSQSYWAAENYLNIWICNITDFLGYAQFPQSSLPGLENASTNRLTDGVVIYYKAFGSIDDGNFNLDAKYNKGRTTTHEIGHFFGLRHIWGDQSGCNATDYVEDTPNQSTSTTSSTCPTHPKSDNCSTGIMFQNFLDYTNDVCMNIFTQGQVNRMKVILENSPRRKSLLTSPGLLPPQPVANDLGIKAIMSPAMGECNSAVTPEIEIRNYGSNNATSVKIEIKRNGVTLQTKTFTSLDLEYLESAVVSFSDISLSTGDQIISFHILETNGVTDGNSANNNTERTVNLPATISVPFSEVFNSVPAGWKILNPDNVFTWELNNAVKAMKIDFFSYEDNLGEIDLLLTPKFNLTSVPVGILLFDVAYSQYQGSKDGLKVVLLENCNTDINQGIVIYSKSGKDLSTTDPSNDPFTPGNSSHWRTESVNLFPYLGQSNLQLAFVGVNDWGNNLYLDNIRVITEDFENIALKKIIEPSPVSCKNTIKPVLLVQNSGTVINSFKVKYTINGSTSEAFYQNAIAPGAEVEVELPTINLSAGLNTMLFELTEPNNKVDLEPSDNTLEYKVVYTTGTTKLPLRENFANSWQDRWASVNPSGSITWSTSNIGPGNNAVYFNAFDDKTTGQETWLVSPLLDFSQTNVATLVFDLSYAKRDNKSDQLQVLASVDCGPTFDIVLAEYKGTSLMDTLVESSWKPEKPAHWNKKTVNLNSITKKEKVRLAFVAKSENGNNLYLDNIEIFLSNNPDTIKIEGVYSIYPNPYPDPRSPGTEVKIHFNLPEHEKNITLEIVDSMGRQFYQSRIEDEVLNQTYTLPLQNAAAGIYYVRVTTSKGSKASRLVIYR